MIFVVPFAPGLFKSHDTIVAVALPGLTSPLKIPGTTYRPETVLTIGLVLQPTNANVGMVGRPRKGLPVNCIPPRVREVPGVGSRTRQLL